MRGIWSPRWQILKLLLLTRIRRYTVKHHYRANSKMRPTLNRRFLAALQIKSNQKLMFSLCPDHRSKNPINRLYYTLILKLIIGCFWLLVRSRLKRESRTSSQSKLDRISALRMSVHPIERIRGRPICLIVQIPWRLWRKMKVIARYPWALGLARKTLRSLVLN